MYACPHRAERYHGRGYAYHVFRDEAGETVVGVLRGLLRRCIGFQLSDIFIPSK